MATARSFENYDLAAVLADLIDNSIQANARNIWETFDLQDDGVTVRICDDGRVIEREVLIKAMRPATRNPEENPDALDLGRFGCRHGCGSPLPRLKKRLAALVQLSAIIVERLGNISYTTPQTLESAFLCIDPA